MVIEMLMGLAALTTAQQTQIKRYFDADLFDGPSARWKWPDRRGSGDVYCGWVNAKNRLGAYVGWRPFVVTYVNRKLKSGGIAGGDGMGKLVDTLCPLDGYDYINPPRD